VTDSFDRVVGDILVRTSTNGGPTSADLLQAMRASHDDSASWHASAGARLEDLDERLKDALAILSDHAVVVARGRASMDSEDDRVRAAQAETLERVRIEHDAIHARHVADGQKQLDAMRKDVVAEIERCCTVAVRAPGSRGQRRESDPREMRYVEDEQLGDMRRVWRVARWIVIAGGGAAIVVLADACVQLILGQ
jgi:hypothetical protein